jgi:hypothetical protein
LCNSQHELSNVLSFSAEFKATRVLKFLTRSEVRFKAGIIIHRVIESIDLSCDLEKSTSGCDNIVMILHIDYSVEREVPAQFLRGIRLDRATDNSFP